MNNPEVVPAVETSQLLRCVRSFPLELCGFHLVFLNNHNLMKAVARAGLNLKLESQGSGLAGAASLTLSMYLNQNMTLMDQCLNVRWTARSSSCPSALICLFGKAVQLYRL